ncbi:hypothetical protein JCM11641_006723 [Rhodosporidiobolus odoratus]
MRLELTPTPACQTQLAQPPPSVSDPPLVFIDSQPFLLELQGKLELPPNEIEQAQRENAGRGEMEGVRVGKVDLSDPVRSRSPPCEHKKPILRIAHHRLEGKLETLLTPYALLRTTRVPASSSSFSASSSSASERPAPGTTIDEDGSEVAQDDPSLPSAKRPKLDPSLDSSSSRPSPDTTPPTSPPTTEIRIISLIRHKLVFSRRPEPLIEVSSEADPSFLARRRGEGVKPHPLAGLGGPGGAAAPAPAPTSGAGRKRK